MSDDVSFQNMDSWKGGSSGKYGLTFKQICLSHINRCVQNGSVEWHGGYWQEKLQSNWTDRTYVPNSRETYCNSVRMLRALLIGYFDKQMKEADKGLEQVYDETYEEYTKQGQGEEKKSKSEWNTYRVDWHVRLFEQLIMLSKRLNFFEEEVSEEEI